MLRRVTSLYVCLYTYTHMYVQDTSVILIMYIESLHHGTPRVSFTPARPQEGFVDCLIELLLLMLPAACLRKNMLPG